ncbi:hypothetical protein FZC66_13495 [Priestia megaterium]|nr:hypothetical protein FZC66_13495 [Priestia megaterium]
MSYSFDIMKKKIDRGDVILKKVSIAMISLSIIFIMISGKIPTSNSDQVKTGKKASSYEDYDASAYWAESVEWSLTNKVLRLNNEDTKLHPYDEMTELDFLKMMFRYFKPKEIEQNHFFDDFSMIYELADRYNLAVSNDKGSSIYNIKRGQAAKLLVEALTGKEQSEKQAVMWLYDQELVKDSTHKAHTYEGFQPDERITRGEAVTLFYAIYQNERNTLKKVHRSSSVKPYSIHGVTIGDAQEEVEEKFGLPNRSTLNEYGSYWHAYHHHYDQFFMVSYTKGKVTGLYTNQTGFIGNNGLKLGATKEEVRKKLGNPVRDLQKQGMTYNIEDNEYDTYEIENMYLTCFYDTQDSNRLTAVQLLQKNMEQKKQGFYAKQSVELQRGFQLQMFDLINSTRSKYGLSLVEWNDRIAKTALSHSLDMAENHYFSHGNLKGETPFDRIYNDQIDYRIAGENIAMGQFSSIYAHEELMNSLSHRRNILYTDWRFLGIGVSFDSRNIPYYTQNYYSE